MKCLFVLASLVAYCTGASIRVPSLYSGGVKWVLTTDGFGGSNQDDPLPEPWRKASIPAYLKADEGLASYRYGAAAATIGYEKYLKDSRLGYAKQIPLAYEKQIPLAYEKQIPLAYEKQIPLAYKKQLPLGYKKQEPIPVPYHIEKPVVPGLYQAPYTTPVAYGKAVPTHQAARTHAVSTIPIRTAGRNTAEIIPAPYAAPIAAPYAAPIAAPITAPIAAPVAWHQQTVHTVPPPGLVYYSVL